MRFKILFISLILFFPYSSFGAEPYQLEDCIKIALSNRNELTAVNFDVLHAENLINEAKSYYYPKVNLTTGYARFREPTTFEADVDITAIKKPIQPFLNQFGIEIPSLIPQEVEIGKKDWFSVSVDFNQTIFTFGRLKEGLKQAEIAHSLSLIQKERTKKDIILEVKKAFYGLQLARQLYQLLKDVEARSAIVERMVEIAYSTETFGKDGKPVTRLDYLKAKNFRSEVQTKLVEIENGLRLSLSTLKIVMGMEDHLPLEIADFPLDRIPEIDLGIQSEEIKKKALEKNCDINASRLQVNLFESKKKASKLEYLPVLALQGQYIGPEDRFGMDHFWYMGIGLRIPIFDGFLTKAKVGQMESQLQKVKVQNRLFERALPTKIDHLLITLDKFKREIEILKKGIQEAKESIELAIDGFSIGSVEYNDLILFQKMELEFRSTYLQSLYGYHTTLAEIDYLSGED